MDQASKQCLDKCRLNVTSPVKPTCNITHVHDFLTVRWFNFNCFILVYYDQYTDSLEVYKKFPDNEHSLAFVKGHMHKCVHILVCQGRLLKPDQKKGTQEGIELSADVLPSLIRVDPVKFIDISCLLLDPKALIYKSTYSFVDILVPFIYIYPIIFLSYSLSPQHGLRVRTTQPSTFQYFEFELSGGSTRTMGSQPFFRTCRIRSAKAYRHGLELSTFT